MYRARILLVDDEAGNLDAIQKILTLEAYEVVVCHNGSEALSAFSKQSFDLILTDLRMPGISGIELLSAIRKLSDVPVVLMTAYGKVDDAVEAMKLGAVDFLIKPIKKKDLLRAVQDGLSKIRNQKKIVQNHSNNIAALIGETVAMAELKRTIRQLSPSGASIFIEGESGTGKEVVAHLIHKESCRAGELISINCSAIPETLLESELFGYEKGAFTGAHSTKRGLFEAADKGTLFLDEIADMPLSIQAKLLRVLQDGTYYRLGSTEPRHASVRIIAATNKNIREKIQEKSFREDLFYRLNVISLHIPPLRERRDDIILLSKVFLEETKQLYNRQEVCFSVDALECLKLYDWPGNIRELRNVIERAVVMASSPVIEVEHLGLAYFPSVPAKPQSLNVKIAPEKEVQLLDEMIADKEFRFPMGISLAEIEAIVIKKTLETMGGDKNLAAKVLGINPRTIYRKLVEKS